MKLAYDSQKPVINVYYNQQIKNIEHFQQLLYGMEEEGIPYHMESRETGTAPELGYDAASGSNLDVGIGIGGDEILVLHYTKLKREEPLFKISPPYGASILRALGTNAARLVKGIPFKAMSDIEEAGTGIIDGIDMDYLTAVIIDRLNYLLKDKGGAGFA
ncbi:MAG TPA: glycerol dehydratase reactivase beta/small subunit family protein [Negativicutes bacterium]|nr:glycerol dehydratase reactivase beta/small subunit family protein [Negativicutes bacterium]